MFLGHVELSKPTMKSEKEICEGVWMLFSSRNETSWYDFSWHLCSGNHGRKQEHFQDAFDPDVV